MSGNTSSKACRCAQTCTLRPWWPSLTVPESIHWLVWGGFAQYSWPNWNGKLIQSQTSFAAPEWFVCCIERDLLLVKPPKSSQVSHGVPSVPLFPWFSTKAASDFWAQFLTICSRLQLLLFYFVIGLLLLLIHYITFYLYSQNCNIMLLCFCIESKLV